MSLSGLVLSPVVSGSPEAEPDFAVATAEPDSAALVVDGDAGLTWEGGGFLGVEVERATATGDGAGGKGTGVSIAATAGGSGADS